VIALIIAIGIAVGAFDLDHVRAEVREHHAGTGSGDERALLDDVAYGKMKAMVDGASIVRQELQPN